MYTIGIRAKKTNDYVKTPGKKKYRHIDYYYCSYLPNNTEFNSVPNYIIASISLIIIIMVPNLTLSNVHMQPLFICDKKNYYIPIIH